MFLPFATPAEMEKASNRKVVRDTAFESVLQVFGEAYQVPSNPEKREAYGKSEISQDIKVDASAYLGKIFGSDYFDDYVGQLEFISLATIQIEERSWAPESRTQKGQEKMKALQKEREEKLIPILKNRLEPFVEGQTDKFVNWATSEACRLSKAAFGKAMLHTIGYMYTRRALRELGKEKQWFMKVPEWVRNLGHDIDSESAAYSGAISVNQLHKELYKLQQVKNKEKNIDKLINYKKDMMCDSLWQMNVADIECTLNRVCQAVLRDLSVPKDVLKKRAQVMKKLGTIFQVFGEAYQVPSNPEKREAYGKSEISQDIKVDASAYLGNIFGSEYFDDYVGQLRIISLATIQFEERSWAPEGRTQKGQEKMKALQKEREEKLITTLKNRLEPFVECQTDKFVNWATLEACRLSKTAFGKAMLHTIGYMYTRRALRELGKEKQWFMKVPEWVRNLGHDIDSKSAAFSGVISYNQLHKELYKLQEVKNKEKNIDKLINYKKDMMRDSLWQMNVADIECTLNRVCQGVLRDPSAPKDVLKQRAQVMKKLGTIFQMSGSF